MIEVLVSLLVLAFGLLGLAMLQTAGLRFTTDSYSRTQATFHAYDIIERMRMNPAGVNNGAYDVGSAAAAETKINNFATCFENNSCNCDATNCDAGTLAAYDLGRWYKQQDEFLPGAKLASKISEPKRATIQRNGNTVTVTLYWLERDTVISQAWQVVF